MASIHKEIRLNALPEDVWDAVRDVGNIHKRLCPGFLTDCRMDGPDARIVTFGNGMVVREPIVTVDEHEKRLVWSATGAITRHYNAAVQVFPGREGTTRVVWIADFLPDSAAAAIAAAMDAGMAVMRRTLDSLAR